MSDMKHKSQLQWIFKSTLIVSNSSIIVTTKRKDKLMSDLNSNPCMQMIDYMRTFIFLQKILALFIAQDGICTGNVAAYSVTFTCVQLQGLSYYCIQSQPCNENNCFMAFFFFLTSICALSVCLCNYSKTYFSILCLHWTFLFSFFKHLLQPPSATVIWSTSSNQEVIGVC